tara:strand:+ start:339 stop:491 length:153 start_codon:yes stop_codon:yes gene_type:complete
VLSLSLGLHMGIRSKASIERGYKFFLLSISKKKNTIFKVKNTMEKIGNVS